MLAPIYAGNTKIKKPHERSTTMNINEKIRIVKKFSVFAKQYIKATVTRGLLTV